jgi:AcrR family transcriptional regulator
MKKAKTQAERLREISRSRREQEKESLRRAILDAAGDLFLEYGYEALSMRQIAERIGYSATTIYRHFENKDNLLFAIVYEGFLRFGQQLAQAAQSSDTPLGRLKALGYAYIEFALKNPVFDVYAAFRFFV